VTDLLPHPLRSDARDNRELILAAARELFAAEGLNVTMRQVARRAGVGPATLYRHFPAKEVLVTAALAGQMRACHAIVEAGLADPDPWHGFCLVIVLDDLVLVLMANGGIRAASPAAAVAASRRFAALAIEAFAAEPQTAPLPPPARLASVLLIP
jgi:AcrR family transcriptional regulator